MSETEEKPDIALLDQAILQGKHHADQHGYGEAHGHQQYLPGGGEHTNRKFPQHAESASNQYSAEAQEQYFRQYSSIQVPVFPGQMNRYPVIDDGQTPLPSGTHSSGTQSSGTLSSGAHPSVIQATGTYPNSPHGSLETPAPGSNSDDQLSFVHRSTGDLRSDRKCKICGKTLSTAQSLEFHMRTHSVDKPYKCEVCGRALSTKQGLKYHLRTHTGEKMFECEICKKPLVTKQSLEFHMRTHSDVKPFKCELCAKSLTTRQGLIYHMGTHTGEKPYKCTKCKRLLVTKQSLEVHMRTHNQEIESYNENVDSTHLIDHLKKYYGDNP